MQAFCATTTSDPNLDPNPYETILNPFSGDVTIHDEWVVHGSGGNLSKGTRRTYVIAFRAAETVRAERAAGFTHSHNDSVNCESAHAATLRAATRDPQS